MRLTLVAVSGLRVSDRHIDAYINDGTDKKRATPPVSTCSLRGKYTNVPVAYIHSPRAIISRDSRGKPGPFRWTRQGHAAHRPFYHSHSIAPRSTQYNHKPR